MGDSAVASVGLWRLQQGGSNQGSNPHIKGTSSASTTSSPQHQQVAPSTPSSTQRKVANSMGKSHPPNPTAQAANAPLTVRIKRGHVSKACTNCRKMHAACDRARPCSRCVFNKLESSCVDIPRKKRVSRKKSQSQDDSSSVEDQEIVIKKDVPVSSPWSSEMYMTESQKTPQESNSIQENSATPDMWTETSFLSPEPLFLSELLAEEEKRIYSCSQRTPPSNESFSRMVLNAQRTPKQESISLSGSSVTSSSSASSKQQYEIEYLLQEVERLKESNNDLTSKLMTVTEELSEVKIKTQGLMQIVSNHILIPRDLNNGNLGSLGATPPP